MSVPRLVADRTVTEATLTCLADERRREILRVLDREGAVDRRTLAERVAAAEGERSEEAIASVEVALYHVHLPKLEDAGLVTYDERRDRIALRPSGAAAEGRLAER